MPIFELSEDELANPTRLTLNRLENLMLWPSDPKYQKEASKTAAVTYIVNEARSFSKVLATGAEIADILKLAADALPLTHIQEKAREPFRRGVIAGRIVHDSIGWQSVNPTMAGLQRTKAIISKTLGISISQIENNIWKPYRDVAHFWAAHCTLYLEDAAFPFPCSRNGFIKFLGVSKFYLSRGYSRATQAPTTVLNAKTAWTIDDNLPVCEVPVIATRKANSSTVR